jgi:hypothetical protein
VKAERDMSFDICLQCDRDGKSAPWKREIVEQIFGHYVVYRDEDHGFMRLEFPDGGGSDVYMGINDDIKSMMFSHSGGQDFFEALYQLIDRIHGYLFWPADPPFFVITDAATITHVPGGFLESGFVPLLVKSGTEIIAAIERY